MVETKKKSIVVLLSTYNGGLYLEEFLESLSSQSCNDWFLIIRDDGSTDGTVVIIKKFVSQRCDCYFLDDGLHLGVVQSFNKLLQYAKGMGFSYYMFADQDDIWLHDKIEHTFKTMTCKEQHGSSTLPLLVHTDLKVVNKELIVVSSSLADYQNRPKKAQNFIESVFFNNVTGCTVMINLPLANLIDKIPLNGIMHDYWLGLVASSFGSVIFIDQATVLYRQHDLNDTGAKQWNLTCILSKLIGIKQVKEQVIKKINQYNEFCDEFRNIQTGLLPFPVNGGFWIRRKWLIKSGFYNGKFIRKLALILLI